MRPLFQAGEEVKLVSKMFPQYNGDYTIVQVIKDGDTYVDHFTGKPCRSPEDKTYGYILNDGSIKYPTGNSLRFAESSLRKKYPPADFTFDELLANIRSSDLISA